MTMRRLLLIAALSITTVVMALVFLPRKAKIPPADHVVIVVMENHSFDQIIDVVQAPYIYKLANKGALFTNSFAVAHPSQPNYFALFSGSTHGIKDNETYNFDLPNLAQSLENAGKTFIGYVETGSPRKHNPWESFSNALGTGRNLSEFPHDFTKLPTVSFVIPNLDNDMHNGSVTTGDEWLAAHIGAYAEWAITHNSLLIVTFDEDDHGAENRIATIVHGARIRPGRYAGRISHYSVLRTLLDMYALPAFGEAASAPPILDVWE
jgi:hypothetical protein